jgi:hypothetical protein
MTPRRFPPPWTVVEHPESFWVQDVGGQTVGCFYFRHNEETARQAKVLTRGRGPPDGGELRQAAGATWEGALVDAATSAFANRQFPLVSSLQQPGIFYAWPHLAGMRA